MGLGEFILFFVLIICCYKLLSGSSVDNKKIENLIFKATHVSAKALYDFERHYLDKIGIALDNNDTEKAKELLKLMCKERNDIINREPYDFAKTLDAKLNSISNKDV